MVNKDVILFTLVNNKYIQINQLSLKEQSTGNRKTWARIPAQSKESFFHRKIFKFNKYIHIFVHNCTSQIFGREY